MLSIKYAAICVIPHAKGIAISSERARAKNIRFWHFAKTPYIPHAAAIDKTAILLPIDKIRGDFKTALSPAKKGSVMILITINDCFIPLLPALKKGTNTSHPASKESTTIKDQVKVFAMA